jgi:ADP-dependent NAD(P)H-hydrate dehydratase / NAD(P)H-hydrate epimerase
LMGFALPGSGALGNGDVQALRAAAEGKDAIVFGPGIPRGEETAALVGALGVQGAIPWGIDADGLNAIASNPALRAERGPWVLTPHPGEMARLTGQATADVQRDRLSIARELASARNAVVALKGAATVVASPSGEAWINPTGNPGMATAGTGDVLAGMIGALLAQGLAPEHAAASAVYAHGLAGDLIAERVGHLGLVATDLLRGICDVWVRWGR